MKEILSNPTIKSIERRVLRLDTTMFDSIRSQTRTEDKISLLAIQRATARWHKRYAYLEIGSYLGGSIQPHLLDHRCERIYSVDPRPTLTQDDRKPQYTVAYGGNSTQRMVQLLKNVDIKQIDKLECFESDVSELSSTDIVITPSIAFIDGEHTTKAVISDFMSCDKLIRADGTIVFHDYFIIFPAIREICLRLDREHRKYIGLRLGHSIFALFYDSKVVYTDFYLFRIYAKDRIRRIMPDTVWHFASCVRKYLRVYLMR